MKTFRQKKKKYNDSKINISEFFEHFKNLSSKLDVSEDEECKEFLRNFDDCENIEVIYEELDLPFSSSELRQCVKKLGNNKACSTDNIIYEYFKESIDYLDKPLLNLFNYILIKKTFPKNWSKGVIIPIYKMGDQSDPANYRGITLISCFSKLFTSLVNERLKARSAKYDILSDVSNHSIVQ